MTEKELALNMSDDIAKRFEDLFNEENWTWSGLAYILVKRFGIVDLGELDICIRDQLSKKGLDRNES
jgi:hypothetical protein